MVAAWIERKMDLTIPVPKWFDEDLFNTVVQRLGEGETMRGISKEMGFNKGCFWRVCEDYPELANRYARARDVQAHDHFERIIDLAKQVENGEIDPQAAKVAIDARKWAACKLMPRKYGDKIEVDTKVTHEVGDSVMQLLNGIRAEQGAVIDVPAIEGELVLEPLPIEQAPIPSQETPEEIC